MKKIVIFSGAGLDQESGIPTFRDCVDGLWYNYKISEVATDKAWKNTPEKVLDFYNERRKALYNAQPNDAHYALAKLEEKFLVTHVTQNVSDLLQRGGATNVFHLHGELTKMRGSNKKVLYECTDDIKIGDKCPNGTQLRPHLVLFGEYPYNVDEACGVISQCDYLLIIGTGFDISYTAGIIGHINDKCKVYYIDPKPSRAIEQVGVTPIYIRKKASEGVTELVNELLKNEI